MNATKTHQWKTFSGLSALMFVCVCACVCVDMCVRKNMKIDLCDFPSYTYIPNKGIK